MINLDDIRLLLQWIDDVSTLEMIEMPNYRKEYFSFESVSTSELNILCDNINPILKELKCPIRICWIAGEIRPVLSKKRIKILDEWKK